MTPHWNQVQESPGGSQSFLLDGNKDTDRRALVIRTQFFLLAASQELLGGQIGSRRLSSSFSSLSREGSRLERACKPDYLMSLQKLSDNVFGAAE